MKKETTDVNYFEEKIIKNHDFQNIKLSFFLHQVMID